MRGHICGGLSVRRGFTIVKWTEQKLNTRNSTESDIVGLNISMPDMMKNILCGGLRIPGHGKKYLPGQQEHHSPAEKWEVVK